MKITKWNVTIFKYFAFYKSESTTCHGPIYFYTDFFDNKEKAMVNGITKARKLHLAQGEFSPENIRSDMELLKKFMERGHSLQWHGPAGILQIEIIEITENLWG